VAEEHRITSEREMGDLLRARYPVLYVVSSEEDRVERAVARWLVDEQ
jgi:hypothetical protein